MGKISEIYGEKSGNFMGRNLKFNGKNLGIEGKNLKFSGKKSIRDVCTKLKYTRYGVYEIEV